MGRLYLVRHAQTRIDPSKNASEWGLEAAGQSRLAALAALPSFATAYRVAASSEFKAMATAEAIRAAHPELPPVEGFGELKEVHKASYVGDDHDAVMARLFAEPDRPTLPGWERAADALARFAGRMERLVAEAEGRDLIVASHATVESLWLARLKGQERVVFEEWRSVGMPDVAIIDIETMQVVQPFGAWLGGGESDRTERGAI
jgi:broad specificity phosphatase PhoE